MNKRKLGDSGIEIAPLAFGGNVFGFTIDEKTSHNLLDEFVKAGFNLIDTANSYSRWKPGNKGGESETIIGNWLKKTGNREKVIIATKVGSDMGLGRPCLSKKYILEEVEASLRRLQTDYIDLYQSHFDDLLTPVGETIEAFSILIQQGKVRSIGASNLSVERLKESLEFSKQTNLPRYETLQPEYNLYMRKKYEEEYESLCVKENLSVITYFSLASGFLTGKYRNEKDLNKSMRGDGIKKYLTKRSLKILDALEEVAREYKSTPASVSLAWLLTRNCIAAPIASATTVLQLQDILMAASIQLNEGSIQLLNGASEY